MQAAELPLAQPALSRAIQALEADPGVRLPERDRHKVALTPAGAALAREAETLLARTAAARRRVQAAGRAPPAPPSPSRSARHHHHRRGLGLHH